MKRKSNSLRRSGRRGPTAYKKGDYIEFQLNGRTVTGRLLKKSPRSSAAHPIWIVAPSDRRRKNEEVPERSLGKIIDVEEAMNNKSAGRKKNSNANKIEISNKESSQTSSNSDGSGGDGEGSFTEPPPQANKRKSSVGKGSSSEEGTTSNPKKRKSDLTSESDRVKQQRKTVTFEEGKGSNNASTANNTNAASETKKGKGTSSSRIGTRSGTRLATRSSGEIEEIPLSLPAKKKKKGVFKGKKLKKDENVVVVKMLTGTLYMYRGERPRAEFVRFK